MTHTKVVLFKMMLFILGNKSYGGTDRINVGVDVHMKMSHAKCTSVTTL
jgi:hypothetical protein